MALESLDGMSSMESGRNLSTCNFGRFTPPIFVFGTSSVLGLSPLLTLSYLIQLGE